MKLLSVASAPLFVLALQAMTFGQVMPPATNRQAAAIQVSVAQSVPGCVQKSWNLAHTGVQPAPQPREQFGLACDTKRNRVVLFGGASATSVLGDTWEWDGARWADVTPTTTQSPPPRWGCAMAFDSVNNRVVLHGGQSTVAPTVLGDMWAWDGAAWEPVTSTGSAPPANGAHRMVFHQAYGAFVMFGGFAAGTDTWEWTATGTGPVTGRWDRYPPSTPVHPGYRYYHAMTYDSARGETLLHGGRDAGGVPYPETWSWKDHVWTLRDTTGPSANGASWIYHSMEYERSTGYVVMDLPGQPYTWLWNGSRWTSVDGGDNGYRMRSAMTWDSATRRLMMFGGVNHNIGGVYFNDTWCWCDCANPLLDTDGDGIKDCVDG